MYHKKLQENADLEKRLALLHKSMHEQRKRIESLENDIKKIDSDIMDMLDKAAVTYQIVLTKIDKISSAALERIVKETQQLLKEHTAAHISVLKTSSEKNLFLDELKNEIAEFVNF